MSSFWKRVIVVIFLIFLTGGAGLLGGITGAVVMDQVWQYRVRTTPTTVPIPVQAVEQEEPTLTPEPTLPPPNPTDEIVTRLEIQTTEIQTAITQAVETTGPAVVTVVGAVGRGGISTGSGVFISEDGFVLTNNHVIENTERIYLILADGEHIPAELVGGDPFSDLAVLKVDEPVPAVAQLGNSDALRPGETVIAIGSPWGISRIPSRSAW
jgi:S1-C subfamily serine protease